MRRRWPPLAWALLLPLWACAGIPVRTDYDPATEFRFYTTYHIVPGRAGEAGVEGLTETRVRRAVAEAMLRKGLAEAPRDRADLVVRWRTGFRVRLVVDDRFPGPSRHRRPYEIRRVREGTLTISLVDRRRNREVWRGTATGVTARNGREALQAAVWAILDRYPPMHP